MKHIAVLIRAGQPERVAEALRGALGLSLRGDRVEVVLADPARAAADSADPHIRRALATLEALGHRVERGDAAMAAALGRAHAVEVWT